MPVSHPETCLPPNCEQCGVGTVRIGKLPRIGLRPLVHVYKCGGCNQITSVEPEAAERSRAAPLGVGAPAAALVSIDRI
jgi:hypothetical protein